MISNGAAVASRSRGRAFHRQHGSLQRACGRRSARPWRSYRSYPRIVGETGGKDFILAHPSADPAALAVGDRPRRLRIPGAEVLGGEPRLRAALAVERRARPRRGDDGRHQDGRRPRLPQLHGRGHRQAGVRQDQRLHRPRQEERDDHRRRRLRHEHGLLHRADARRDRRSRVSSCCAKRSSGRSSRLTSTTMRSGTRRWRSWTRRRRMR